MTYAGRGCAIVRSSEAWTADSFDGPRWQPAAITPAYHYGRPHYRRYPPRVRVYPRYAQPVPYFDDYSNFYPAVRGFGDRNPVPRGNMRGCTVDMGYGRYESCDK